MPIELLTNLPLVRGNWRKVPFRSLRIPVAALLSLTGQSYPVSSALKFIQYPKEWCQNKFFLSFYFGKQQTCIKEEWTVSLTPLNLSPRLHDGQLMDPCVSLDPCPLSAPPCLFEVNLRHHVISSIDICMRINAYSTYFILLQVLFYDLIHIHIVTRSRIRGPSYYQFQ